MSVEIRAIKIIGLGLGVLAVTTGCSGDMPNPLALHNGERDRTECMGVMPRYEWRDELVKSVHYKDIWTMDGKKELKIYDDYSCGRWDFRGKLPKIGNNIISVCNNSRELTVKQFLRELQGAQYDGQWNMRAAQRGFELAACSDKVRA